MGHSSKCFPLGLALLLLFHCCAAQLETITARGQQGTQLGGGTMQQQRHTVGRTQQDQCQLESLNPLEPSRRIEAEAGFSEIWEVQSAQELQCAGIGAIRHVIRPRGLMLPAYANSPELMYVVQGKYPNTSTPRYIYGCDSLTPCMHGQRKKKKTSFL